MVQEYPESAGFVPALDQALEQMAACGVQPHWVAGNHDLGDKPDPTMPTHPVTAEGLEAYHQRFGPSWYSFDYHDLHLVVLNSQILNTGLPAEEEQRTWLEADLAAHAQMRIAVFLHLPPYLHNPAESHLGHYDNIGEPAPHLAAKIVSRPPSGLALCSPRALFLLRASGHLVLSHRPFHFFCATRS